MVVVDYKHQAGKHWETTAMRNALAQAGVTAPHTGEPLSEAMCLGIAGGISIGYSFCPSAARWDMGSGVSAVGRYAPYVTGAENHVNFFQRLGAKTTVKESGGAKAALANLKEGLEAGKPVIVWTGPPKFSPIFWTSCLGMYSLLAFGLDEAKGEAHVADHGGSSVTLPLDELAAIRGQVCSHKNRSLTFEPPKKLTAPVLKEAILAGVKVCVDSFVKPKLKTYGPPGLLEWGKTIANPKNKKGWPKVFGDGRIYLPLRDTYDSIETAGTGGGLFRPLFADFLDEAAKVTGKKKMNACATRYRQLAKRWGDLANAALPDDVKPFAQTKALFQKRCRVYEQKGPQGGKELEVAKEQFRAIEDDMRRSFPLDEAQTGELLEDLSRRLVDLHEAECAAADDLAAAVA